MKKATVALRYAVLSAATITSQIMPERRGVWVMIAGIIIWLVIGARARASETASKRLRRMMTGSDFLLMAFIIILSSTVALIISVYSTGSVWPEKQSSAYLVAAISSSLFAVFMLIAGFFLVVLSSKHLRVVWRVMLLALWWAPVFNIYLFYKVLRKVNAEYRLATTHELLMETHAENLDCATKYPMLMVHGIFFRDWQLVNYWGRIPRELTRCGARIFYGGQQSAAPVAESAAELAERISEVLTETGTEKINIIAHSKGGLDSRFAISKLGMAPCVASLTTVNTPHRGCVWARTMLEKLPEHIIKSIEKRYNSLFRKLGDKNPDILGGVRDLTDTAARRFNEDVPDSPEVCYQSAMSLMSKASSAPFPLNVCWRLATRYDREPNDGMVARSSAPWGTFFGNVTANGRRGVSHGDMVDLFREDIDGFDVAAFYADIVRGLKQKGF